NKSLKKPSISSSDNMESHTDIILPCEMLSNAGTVLMQCCSRKVFKAALLLLSVNRIVTCLFMETVNSFATKRRQYQQ
ncbi:hypothetical protein, partial [Neisseria sp. P0006.S010]|uniref:hypothetical protein n=1 Tax=Neisseria sp. P0006.S010 TaxID=3436693 RepID=UPI003F80B22D